jgi:hypothetical protein
VTYQGDTTKTGNRVLKALVVLAIVFIAWWAARGGYDQVPTITPTSTTDSTSTTIEG